MISYIYIIIISVLVLLFILFIIGLKYQLGKDKELTLSAYTNRPKLSPIKNSKDYTQEITESIKFNLFQIGENKQITNLLAGMNNNRQWQVFNYRYENPNSNQNLLNTLYIVAKIHLNKQIPNFILTNRNFSLQPKEIYNYKNIDFKIYPKFAEIYTLKSDNEYDAINFFSPIIIDFFQNNLFNGVIEIERNHALFYTIARDIEQEFVQSFINEVERFIDFLEK